MKIITKTLLIVGALFLSANMFAQTKQNKKHQNHHKMEAKTTQFHSLFFWLDPSLSPEEVKEFQQFFVGLSKLPYQKNLHFGVPAKSSPRTVLDQTYTYNCTMEFDSLEDLEAYGKLPEHLALVAKYKPFFVKMKVYDTAYIQ